MENNPNDFWLLPWLIEHLHKGVNVSVELHIRCPICSLEKKPIQQNLLQPLALAESSSLNFAKQLGRNKKKLDCPGVKKAWLNIILN